MRSREGLFRTVIFTPRGLIPYCRSIDSMYAAATLAPSLPVFLPYRQSEARKPICALAASTVIVFIAVSLAALTFFGLFG